MAVADTSRTLGLLALMACGGGAPAGDDGTSSPSLATEASGPSSTDDVVDSGWADTGSDPTTQAPDTPTTPAPVACSLGPVDTLHYTLEMPFEGRTRKAIVDLPEDYDGTELRPLVLNFHGLATTAQHQKSYTGMADAGNDRGWLVVHPDGTNRSWDWLSESQDVRFVDALLDALEADLCVDPKRVYLTGLSNGGYFSYQFACDRGDRVTAIAPVAGAQTAPFCQPGVKVPLLHIHGTDDDTVPYDGNWISPSAYASVSGWARKVNDCDDAPEISAQIGDVTCETWSCSATDTASLCTVDGGGHTWPGAIPVPILGETNQDIDATQQILDFFARWARP